jgi:hypothetical protein
MSRIRRLLVFVVLLMGPNRLFAQDDSVCVALLQHGIFDRTRTQTQFSSASDIRGRICTAYSQLKSHSLSASARADVIGIFGGDAHFSEASLEAIGQVMCETTSSVSSVLSQMNVFQQLVSPEGASAFKECVALNAVGLKSKTDYREEDQGNVTIEIRYVAPPGAPAQTQVSGVVIQPPNSFSCTGRLAVTRGGLTVGTEAVAMSCDRAIAAEPFDYLGRKVRAKPATISVQTSSGTVTRHVGAIQAGPPATPLTIPTGSLMPYSGTLADAQALTAFGWWVADGRRIDDPLSPMHGSNTPDLKDRFVMGSITPATTGGAKSFSIPDQVVDSHTTGGFGPPTVNSDPFTHMQGNHTWTQDSSIYSQGTWKGTSVPTVPPYYSVIYLIKVR